MVTVGSSSSWGDAWQSIWVMKLDSQEKGFLVAGHSQSRTINKNDAWILKLTMDGNIEWEKHFIGSGINVINRIISSVDSGILAVDYTSSKGVGWQDAWVIQLDKDGNLEWEKTFGGDKQIITTGIITRDDESVFLFGKIQVSDKEEYDGWIMISNHN